MRRAPRVYWRSVSRPAPAQHCGAASVVGVLLEASAHSIHWHGSSQMLRQSLTKAMLVNLIVHKSRVGVHGICTKAWPVLLK
jgi:hypothetical protein